MEIKQIMKKTRLQRFVFKFLIYCIQVYNYFLIINTRLDIVNIVSMF